MDPSYSHNRYTQQRLPSPAQLHLQPSVSSPFARNTLAPIPARFDHHTNNSLSSPESSPEHGLSHQWSHHPHRTSSSRDELHPSALQHLQQQQQNQDSAASTHRQAPPPNQLSAFSMIKRESGTTQNSSQQQNPSSQAQGRSTMPAQEPNARRPTVDDSLPSASDFVKKLFKMLEDPSFQPIVSWGPQGDCFVVKDMNEFTKSILPRLFKHSNFASFVRQLNKYDFRKVKNSDEPQFGEHSWTFRHPDFHADRRSSLENIKRKVPAQRKTQLTTVSAPTSTSLPLSDRDRDRERNRERERSPSSSSPSSYQPLDTPYILSHQTSHLRDRDEDKDRERDHDSPSTNSHHLHSHTQAQLSSLQAQLTTLQMQFTQLASQNTTMSSQLRGLTEQNESLREDLAILRGEGGVSPSGVGREVGVLKRDSENVRGRMRVLERGYEDLLVEVAGFRRFVEGAQPPSRLQAHRYSTSSSQIPPSQNQDQRQRQSLPIRVPNPNPGSNTSQGHASTANANGSSTFLNSDMTREQMNDMSRTAEDVGFAYGGIRNGERPPSGIWMAAGDRVEFDRASNAGATGTMGEEEGVFGRGDAHVVADAGDVEVDVDLDGEDSRGQSFGSSEEEECVMPTPMENGDEGTSASEGAGPSSAPADSTLAAGPLTTTAGSDEGNGWIFDASGFAALNGMRTGGSEQRCHQDSSSPPSNSSGGGGSQYRAFDGESMASTSTSLINNNNSGTSSSSSSSSSTVSTSQKLRVRGSTFVPGWAVPPRVLLVDDDAVSRRLSSKFLEVFGCAIDVAVDGVGAVNKMNLEKYDLVLMDIVMPKLDGVSATSLIRKFDHMTPIISMTSNSKPNEIMSYYSSGMNDILSKPFTKQSLLNMLEKHLMHLKVIEQMSRVPRSVGIPPLSDSSFEQAFATHAALATGTSTSNLNSAIVVPFSVAASDNNTISNSNNLQNINFSYGFGGGSGDGDGEGDDRQGNPLAGMGLTDEQYNEILQNFVNGEGIVSTMGIGMGLGTGSGVGISMEGGTREKRSLEEAWDGREAKRSRFEVVE